MNKIPVLMTTYGRLAYSIQALESIVRLPGNPVSVTIWDNGSTDGTKTWLKYLDREKYCIEEIVDRPSNEGLPRAVNYFFRKHHDAKFVVKMDNDTVAPDLWLLNLLEAFRLFGDSHKMGAVSGTCLRPNGLTFQEWADRHMKTVPCLKHHLHFNGYVLGTCVLINMEMIRQRGLLFERLPSKIGGWTDYTRIASEIEGSWNFAFYSKVPVKLLNLAAEHVLSDDYPEYDREILEVRTNGNAWWDAVGGLSGVKRFIDDHGGLMPLTPATEPPPPLPVPSRTQVPPSVWTGAGELPLRSTAEYWISRVQKHGPTASTFLTTPPEKIAEFTEHHMGVMRRYVKGSVLETGCGWGRLSLPISRLATSYVGVDFVPALIAKAKESLPDLDFRVASAADLPFEDGSFDVVVAVTCVSSFAHIFDAVLAECRRVLKPSGVILFLEEDYARMDWKLKH
jgi:glycosyltransferase involved in cell wall biosynthesis